MKKNLLMPLLTAAGICAFIHAQAQTSPADNPANFTYAPSAPASIVQPPVNSIASVPCSTPVTSDAYLCDSGSVALSASNGTAYAWYTTATGGTPVSYNSTYNTPTLYTATSYYVEALCNLDTTMMPLPAATGTYSGDIRGFYFTAPVSFTITGLRVPLDANTGAQTIEILRFNAGAPPVYPGNTNSFTSLGYWNGVNTTTVIDTNIAVNAGDIIGIYGWRNSTNSYSSGGSYTSNIAGFPVTLERSGMQANLDVSQMHDVWSEIGGSISRVEMYYSFFGDTSVRVMSTVHVNPVQYSSNPVTICAGDSVFAQGAYQTVAGTYRDTLQTTAGCDSIITTALTVNPTYLSSSSVTICSGDSIFAAGGYQNTSGIYHDTLQTVAGCDSIIEVVLTVNPVSYFSNPRSVCAGDSIFAAGAYQTIAGSYFDTLQAYNGCDSIVETILTVNALPVITLSSFINDTVCIDDAAMPLPSATPSGGTYSGTGVTGTMFDPGAAGNGTHAITYTYQDNNGCTSADSTVITVIACTGINEYADAQIEIFPNPATDMITIKASILDARIQLVDITGRVITEEVMNGSQVQLDLSALTPAKGIYMVRVFSGNNMVSVKKITRM